MHDTISWMDDAEKENVVDGKAGCRTSGPARLLRTRLPGQPIASPVSQTLTSTSASLMSALQAQRARAAELRAQILDPERPQHSGNGLSALHAQMALVQEQLDSYKYPVLALPPEIVSEIFIHFLPVYPACPPSTGMLSPTILSQICRKWREIALNAPMLWRAIALPINPDFHQAHEVDLWLCRSRCCPISVEIVDMLVYNPAWETGFTGALARLNPHRTRWEHLKLHLPEMPRLHRDAFQDPMPLLRRLYLAFDEETTSDSVVFGEMPLLRSVALNDVAAHKVILPWASLTSLELFLVFPEDCVPILRQTTNLVHCRLTLIPGGNPIWPNVILLRLESLTLLDYGRPYPVPGYAQTFIVPALRELQITERFLEEEPCHSLALFMLKSGCKPQKIYILGEMNTSREVYSNAFPSIQFERGNYVIHRD